MSTTEATLALPLTPAELDSAADAPANNSKRTSRSKAAPTEFVYALPGFNVRRRSTGWWFRSEAADVGEKPKWIGPFTFIEPMCLCMARRFACDIAERHTVWLDRHGIQPGDPLYGLKPNTRLQEET